MYANAARTRSTIPGVSTAPAGEIATTGYSGIAPQGTYRQPAALPGTAGNPNIPSTYSVPGAGSAEVPYKTIDVPATPVEGNRLNPRRPIARYRERCPLAIFPHLGRRDRLRAIPATRNQSPQSIGDRQPRSPLLSVDLPPMKRR